MNDKYVKNNLWECWLNSTAEFVFFKDINGMYIAASKSTQELAGLTSENGIVGKYDYEIYPTYLAQAYVKQDKEVIKSKKPQVFKNVVFHPQNGELVIETVKSPIFDEDGTTIIGIQGSARDITERQLTQEKFKEEESKLQALLDNIPVAVWLKDANNRYIAINKEYEKLFGVKKSDIIGSNVFVILQINKLFTETERDLLKDQDTYVFLHAKKSKLEFCVNNENRKKCFEMIKAPILRKSKVIGLVGICNDITDKMH